MKTLVHFTLIIAALLTATYSGGQVQRNFVAPQTIQQVAPVVAPQQANVPVNNFSPQFDSLSTAMNACTAEQLKANMDARQKILNSYNDFPEQLHYYPAARSFVTMDNRFLDCASSLIASLTKQVAAANNVAPVVPMQPAPIQSPVVIHEDCTQKIVYITVAAGSLLLVLLLMLLKFIRAHKIFKDLYDKIYDKVLDELADKLLVATGIKDENNLKEKLKKLVSLNQSRRKGAMNLDEYIRQVDYVLA